MKNAANPAAQLGKAEGDCIDCRRCVQVCPTGIDIRNGLQLECIGCTACIDACDDIMIKVGRPKGLIRYDSFNGFAGKARRASCGRAFTPTARSPSSAWVR
jgi:polyferredoxin